MKDLLVILKIKIKELINFNDNRRIPEPTMAMTFESQIAAFKEASSPDGPLGAVQLFAAINGSRAIAGAKKVLELACGTGHVVTKLAFINPEIDFVAIDLSQGMLNEAEKLANELGIKNIEFKLGDMTDLSAFMNSNIDAVTSSLAFHHLRNQSDLMNVFNEIDKILKNDKCISIFDMRRLKNRVSVEDFAKLHPHDSKIFKEDTINSFLAAFSLDEFKKAIRTTRLKKEISVRTHFVPGFITINSKLMKLSQEKINKIYELESKLSFQNKMQLKLLKF